jgi:hypothetical protein
MNPLSSTCRKSSKDILGTIDVFLNKIDAITDDDFQIESDYDIAMSSISSNSNSISSTLPSCCFLLDASSNNSIGSSAVTNILSLSIPSAITWDGDEDISIATNPTTILPLFDCDDADNSMLL